MLSVTGGGLATLLGGVGTQGAGEPGVRRRALLGLALGLAAPLSTAALVLALVPSSAFRL